MNVIAEIQRINAAELENGTVGTSASWHAKYAESAWVYVGNLPLQLTEGDILCVLSQFGEVRNSDFNTFGQYKGNLCLPTLCVVAGRRH
jgi:RNA-binding motif X-linked protein 2